MMMRIGLRAGIVPESDLLTLAAKARAWGFDGLELDCVGGERHLPAVPDLNGHAGQTRTRLQEQNVRIEALSLDVALDSSDRRENARRRGLIREYLDVAAGIGCPSVRISVGRVQSLDTFDNALSRILENLLPLVDAAAPLGVTILLENSHEFSTSAALWYLLDGVGHPSLGACWSQVRALVLPERPTVSIPRLGSKLGLVHIADVTLDERGVPLAHTRLGEGAAEVAKQVDLLRGVAYDGCLVYDAPAEAVGRLGGPDEVLPQAAMFLRDRIAFQHAVLSAYKGDKNAPKLPKRKAVPQP